MNPLTGLTLACSEPRLSGREEGGALPDNHAQELTWTVHPARRNPAQAVAVGLVVILVPIAILQAGLQPIFAILGFLLLAASLGSFFFPTTVRFDENSVTVRSLWGKKQRQWNRFRSFRYDSEHVRLCTFGHATRLDHFRGLLLRFGGNRKQVLQFVRGKVASPSRGEAVGS